MLFRSGSGLVTLTAHSPITIGTGGITASGDVTLSATTNSTLSNILLNGNVISNGNTVSFSAYNNITQNSFVSGTTGVSATSTGGVITFGANGYSAGSPRSYTDVHGAVVVPLVPASSLVQPFDPNTVLDLLVASSDLGGTFSDNPFAPDNRKKDGLVTEGQLCTP